MIYSFVKQTLSYPQSDQSKTNFSKIKKNQVRIARTKQREHEYWSTLAAEKETGRKLEPKSLTPAGKVTNFLSSLFKLKMAERSEAKSAERSFASKIKIFIAYA